METKKKIARKVTIFFISIMILVTFSSKTIIYFTTPKVVTERIKGGQISNDETVSDVVFNYTDGATIKFDKKYSFQLKINKINVREGDSVKSADILIAFDTTQLTESISQAQIDMEKLTQDLTSFRKDLKRALEDKQVEINDKNDEVQSLQKRINDAKRNSNVISTTSISNSSLNTQDVYDNEDSIDIESEERQLEKMKRELTRMQEDYTSMKNSGEYNGTTENEKQKEINKKQQELDDLNNLLNNYSTVKAPSDSIISKIYVQENDTYDGAGSLIDYRTSNVPTKITATITDDQYNNLKDYIDTNPKCKVIIFGTSEDGIIESIEKKNDKNYMYVTMKSYDRLKNAKPQNVSIKIEKKSKNYNAIVPNEAIFSDGYVYILNENYGFLGKELTVKKVQIKKGEYNSKYTGIAEGLLGNETIITGTDREIVEGQRVMLNNKAAE